MDCGYRPAKVRRDRWCPSPEYRHRVDKVVGKAGFGDEIARDFDRPSLDQARGVEPATAHRVEIAVGFALRLLTEGLSRRSPLIEDRSTVPAFKRLTSLVSRNGLYFSLTASNQSATRSMSASLAPSSTMPTEIGMPICSHVRLITRRPGSAPSREIRRRPRTCPSRR